MVKSNHKKKLYKKHTRRVAHKKKIQPQCLKEESVPDILISKYEDYAKTLEPALPITPAIDYTNVTDMNHQPELNNHAPLNIDNNKDKINVDKPVSYGFSPIVSNLDELCFAGFSPSNNLYENDELYEFNNSFDDPFDADFLSDDDFETFSFNDMGDNIFDRDDVHYSTSETEFSEDDKPISKHEDQEPLANEDIHSELSDISQFYNEWSDEEEDSFELEATRVLRSCRLLDSFPRSPKRLFAPNKFLTPSKSVLKLTDANKVTFVVSAKNGNVRDATKYATELNSENCDGITLPSNISDTVSIAANQTKRNRKKHKKAAIIEALEVKRNIDKQNNTETHRPVGIYSESALTSYLQNKGQSYFFRKKLFETPQSNATQGAKQLRRYNSSIQLSTHTNNKSFSDAFVDPVLPITEPQPLPAPTFSQKKFVRWALKLEW